MYIYIFRSRLFGGQNRTIITSFPVRSVEDLTKFVNLDNAYDYENQWRLSEVKAWSQF